MKTRESGYLSRVLEVGFSLVGALPCLHRSATPKHSGGDDTIRSDNEKSGRFYFVQKTLLEERPIRFATENRIEE